MPELIETALSSRTPDAVPLDPSQALLLAGHKAYLALGRRSDLMAVIDVGAPPLGVLASLREGVVRPLGFDEDLLWLPLDVDVFDLPETRLFSDEALSGRWQGHPDAHARYGMHVVGAREDGGRCDPRRHARSLSIRHVGAHRRDVRVWIGGPEGEQAVLDPLQIVGRTVLERHLCRRHAIESTSTRQASLLAASLLSVMASPTFSLLLSSRRSSRAGPAR